MKHFPKKFKSQYQGSIVSINDEGTAIRFESIELYLSKNQQNQAAMALIDDAYFGVIASIIFIANENIKIESLTRKAQAYVDRHIEDTKKLGEVLYQPYQDILDGVNLHESTLRIAASLIPSRCVTSDKVIFIIQSYFNRSSAVRDARFIERVGNVPCVVDGAYKHYLGSK